jgi:hypothetical protein
VGAPEIEDIARLEVAHFGTAFLLCEAGFWVLVCVFPAMMQQQQHSRDKERPGYNEKHHAPSVPGLNSNRTSLPILAHARERESSALSRMELRLRAQ